MYGLWSSSLVLMMAILFSVCTTANTEEGTKQKCQGSVMKLKCLNKSYALSIVAVFYGREYPGSNMCRSPNSKLSDELRCERNENNVTGDVKRLCEGKNSCNFTIESPTFSLPDKCPKVYKYMHIDYKCVKIKKSKREKVVAILVTPTPSLVKTTSRITTSYNIKTSTFTSTEVIKPSTTMVAIVDRLLTTHQSQDTSPRSSSLSSSRPHSVSVTTVSHTQRSPSTTIESLERPRLRPTKPSSKTYENSAISADRHGTMKLFRFIVSFHIIREETIEKRTASSVVWFLFGLLVGLFIMIAVLVYYRVKQARRERKDKPNKEAYIKQKNWSETGTIEENTILHPKQLEVLEMESQLGETV